MDSGLVDKIATGHTKSDQAETVLYRLLRGSGTAGLSGIRPVALDSRLVRPLLAISREEIHEFLTTAGIMWREDKSNSDPVFVRNRIRHNLMPLIVREFSASIADILAGTAEVARDEEEYWSRRMDELSSRLFVHKQDAILISASQLSGREKAEARRLIRRGAELVKGDLRGLDVRHIDRVMELARQPEGHGRMQAPGVDVFRSFDWLRLSPLRTTTREERDYCIPVNLPSKVPLPGQESDIRLDLIDFPDRPNPTDLSRGCNIKEDWLDFSRLVEPYEIRNWRPGDFIDLDRGTERIKLLFQEARVPIWDRQGWPVLTSGGKVVWARQFGVDRDARLQDSSRRAVRISEVARAE